MTAYFAIAVYASSSSGTPWNIKLLAVIRSTNVEYTAHSKQANGLTFVRYESRYAYTIHENPRDVGYVPESTRSTHPTSFARMNHKPRTDEKTEE